MFRFLPHRYSALIPAISLAGDLVLLNLIFTIGFCWQNLVSDCSSSSFLLFYLYLNVVWLAISIFFNIHKFERHTRKKDLFLSSVQITVFFFFGFLLYFQMVELPYYPRDTIKVLFPVFLALILLWKISLYYLFLWYRKLGFNFRSVIIIGASRQTYELAEFFRNNPWHGYRFLGFFSAGKHYDPYLGDYSSISDCLKNNPVDEVYIHWSRIPSEIRESLNSTLVDSQVKIRILPDMGQLSLKTAELVDYGDVPVIQIHKGPLAFWYNKLIKRFVDILISVFMVLAVVPLLTLVIYILSRITGSYSESVFFKQKRTHSGGKTFWCIKYRTMYPNTQSETKQAEPGDSRITPIGRILRKTSLDEIPQFVNVLKGEMSIVGPRPHMIYHTEMYSRIARSFMLRHSVKPGITGLAQVNGYRGPVNSHKDLYERVRLDVKYIETWTMHMDVKIILLTFWLLVRGQSRAC